MTVQVISLPSQPRALHNNSILSEEPERSGARRPQTTAWLPPDPWGWGGNTQLLSPSRGSCWDLFCSQEGRRTGISELEQQQRTNEEVLSYPVLMQISQQGRTPSGTQLLWAWGRNKTTNLQNWKHLRGINILRLLPRGDFLYYDTATVPEKSSVPVL